MQSYLMRTNYSSLINSPTFLTPLPILFRFSHSTNFLLNYLVLLIFFFMIILTNLKRISFVTLSSISPTKLETSSSTHFYSSSSISPLPMYLLNSQFSLQSKWCINGVPRKERWVLGPLEYQGFPCQNPSHVTF